MAACLVLQRRPLSGEASCHLKTVSGGGEEEEDGVPPQGALQSSAAVAFCSLECMQTASSSKYVATETAANKR